MKRNVLLAAMMLTAGSLLAADPKDDVSNAAKKLADADNYSWKSTTENGGGGNGFTPGPTEGQVNKDGWADVKMSFGDNDFEMVYKGTNGAMNRGEGWQTFAEMAQGGGGGRRGGGFGRAFTAPATQVTDLLKQVGEVKESGGAYVADLTEDGAKAMMTLGGRGGRGGGGGNGPEISGAKGKVTFWVKDGVLTKYVLKVSGKMTFNDQDNDIDRTTTVEFKNIGTTKVNVPDEAKKKLS